jgi:ribosomal protein L37AE/L43A
MANILSKIRNSIDEWKYRKVAVKDLSRGGPNMPRSQSCPTCCCPSKRQSKTGTGAIYYCRKCKSQFNVIAPATAVKNSRRRKYS